MILKNISIPILLLFGVVPTTVTAYPDYEDERSSIQAENTQNNDNDNDEIYNNPALLQLQIEADEENHLSLNNMDRNMGVKTEVSLKNVRNISNNQLSSEYISLEHEDDHNVDMAEETDEDDNNNNNTSTQTTEQNINASLKEEKYEMDIPLNTNNNRMGKYFSTTSTTMPQFIRRITEQTPTKKDNNLSASDNEEEQIIDHMIKTHTTKMPINKSLDYSSEESDYIVPLAMKYYDEIPPENSSYSHHAEKASSEDYYQDEYNEPELITTTVQALDSNSLHYATNTNTTPTPIVIPFTTTFGGTKIPPTGPFHLSLPTTLSPLPPAPQLQTQTMLGITTTSHIASAAAAAAPTASSDKKGKQIPIVSTIPIVTTTTTTTTRRRLLPHEQLRNYIEDAYIRMPLAVIVDPSADSLENTKTLWNDALRTNLNIKIILVTLNEPEESLAAFNFNNTRQFLAGLNSIKEQNSGDAFRGILDAAELIPYDSAVFISTAQLAKHTDHVQDSAITLLKKRIRLYLIWFGERSLSENETQDSIGGILGEVAIRSGGEILHVISSENSQELEGSTLTIVADALRGSQEVDVPVDTTLSSLHVKIDKLMRRAVLETPNGG